MTRILTPLAITALTLLLVLVALGFALRGYEIRDPTDLTAQAWARVHRLAGVAVGLVIVLVHSIVATYFIGTSRWCREVTDTYGLDPVWASESQRLKRRTFPFAMLGMLLAVVVVASGGAADVHMVAAPAAAAGAEAGQEPGAPVDSQSIWTTAHFLVALVVFGLTAMCLVIEWTSVVANQGVIQAIVNEVRRIREERGLE